MDFLDELENMAAAIASVTQDEQDHGALEAQVRRFQDLFRYSYSEVKGIIERRGGDLSRKTVSDAHWEMVRDEKETEGYDREAYEYAIEAGLVNHQRHVSQLLPEWASRDSKATYLVKLEGPLDSAYKIQDLAGTLELPALMRGIGASGEASFCLINGVVMRAILSTLSKDKFRPTFVRINRADKHLSDCCIAPTLGCEIEPTLPQYRIDDSEHIFLPAQNQYPVWYFFYGTLADPEFLAKKLCLSETPVLRQATITRGIIQTWGGKYKALMGGPTTAKADGWAYEVTSKEHEEQLQYYETNKYEVVRCDILMKDSGESVKGLTFRFVGNAQD
jgi:hypothetical protein